MNKMFYMIPFLLISFTSTAQNNKQIVNNKTFVTNIGSVCEEVVPESDCAGSQIYLILNFSFDEVIVIEEEISTCNEKTINYQSTFLYSIIGNDLKFYPTAEKNDFAYIEKINFKLINNKLVGYTKDLDTNTVEYVFTSSKNKE